MRIMRSTFTNNRRMFSGSNDVQLLWLTAVRGDKKSGQRSIMAYGC